MDWANSFKNVNIGAGIGAAAGLMSPGNLVLPGSGVVSGMATGAGLGGLFSAINSGAKGVYSANGNDSLESLINDERDFNSAEAQKNRDWQEYMSSTAIQRQMNDLKAAGLNPWLALQGGINGAQVGSGAAASSNSAFASSYLKSSQLNNFMKLLTNGITNVTNSALKALDVVAKLGSAAM